MALRDCRVAGHRPAGACITTHGSSGGSTRTESGAARLDGVGLGHAVGLCRGGVSYRVLRTQQQFPLELYLYLSRRRFHHRISQLSTALQYLCRLHCSRRSTVCKAQALDPEENDTFCSSRGTETTRSVEVER